MPAKLTKSNPHLLLQSRLNLIRISNMLSDLYGSTVQAEDKMAQCNTINIYSSLSLKKATASLACSSASDRFNEYD